MRLRELLDSATFPEDAPVSVAVSRANTIETLASGHWPDESSVRETDMFYAASLAKQVTAAVAAWLAKAGTLDVDAPVARYVSGLPAWAAVVTPRQLAHHVSGLPGDDGALGDPAAHWTVERAMAVLRRLQQPPREPGTAWVYSNLGYVLLAELASRAAGSSFADVAAEMLKTLGIGEMVFAGPDVAAFQQSQRLGPVLPLTVGDGGLWCTARGYVKWLEAMNADALGLAEHLAEPGRLTDGSDTDYGWGIGLRTFRGAPLYIHGGEWPGAVAKAVRSPSFRLAVAAFASGSSIDAIVALVDAVLVAEVDA